MERSRPISSAGAQVIGPNDLHIAAHARSEALTLVTNNQREFDRVDGLRTARWV